MKNNNSDPKVVASRSTFDGVTVFLHEDGSLSTRSNFIGRAKLPVATMWRLFDDVCTYTIEELPNFIRGARAGQLPAKPRPSNEASEAIMAENSARRMEMAWMNIIYDRSTWIRASATSSRVK